MHSNSKNLVNGLAAQVFILLTCLFAAPVHAQSLAIDGGIVISWPLPGGPLKKSTETIYFNAGELEVYEWRVTAGFTPETSGIFDSGVYNYATSPWEVQVTGLPGDNRPITLRFHQRSETGGWFYTDTVFNLPAESPENFANEGRDNTPGQVVVLSESLESAKSAEPEVAKKIQVASASNNAVVRSLTATHRDGQTFLTWVEVGDASYNIYRHSAPITDSSLSVAKKLTDKWGPLGTDTSINKHAHGLVPATYVISDLGEALSEQQGLFVYTSSESSDAYYAVTTVVDGVESLLMSSGENTLANPVAESVAATKPVLTVSLNQGKGRVYTQYMDYANWNPTHSGYAYNYAIALPEDYDGSRSYPLMINPHAYGGSFRIEDKTQYRWKVIQLFPSDPGFNQGGAINSWWYGYAADHNYQTGGAVPTSGNIANFTQQRVMMAIEDVIEDPELNVDTSLIHAFGHSMGASGSLSYGIQYGDVFAGIYGSEPMTNYASSPKFQVELEKLWGSQAMNLPIVSRGPFSGSIQKYDGTGVWDWMNHHKQLVDRRGDKMSYLMFGHGKADRVIDWSTQGEPMIRVMNEAKAGFSAHFAGSAGHSWLGFSATVHSLFGLESGDAFAWRYPRDLSFPSIQNATGSGSLTPDASQTEKYNLDIEWATSYNGFASAIVDQPGLYEISLRAIGRDEQMANITPRNTQQFTPAPGATCHWKTIDGNVNQTIDEGQATADRDGLVTVNNVWIKESNGTRLLIDCV